MLWISSTMHLLAFVAPKTPGVIPDCSIDVAVIGSGFAGLAAAIEAANSGASRVCIYEKMPTPGGNSVWNAGQIAAVGTPYQSEAGIKDSVQTMKADMLKAGLGLNHPHLLDRMIRSSAETVRWTENELGVRYRERVTQMGGHSVPRTLSTEHATGRDIINPMLRIISDHPNIELHLNTKMDELIVDGGRIAGVRISRTDSSEGPQNVECSRGVVLASGGFAADVDFRSAQNPSFHRGFATTNQPGATAEVLKEALKIGALPVQLSRIQLGPGTSPDEDRFGIAPWFCNGACLPYGIVVDPKTAKRFVNEMGNRYERSMAIVGRGHPAVCVTDAEGAKRSLERDLTKLKPTVREHASLEEVAKAYGMDAAVLAETVADYNAGVAAGRDALGKALRDDAGPISTPPFYSIRLWPKVHHCMGGLGIDERAQVINVDGRPIEGLFAAGEVAGGVHGADRLASCATLDCLAFGRIAGQSVARFGGG